MKHTHEQKKEIARLKAEALKAKRSLNFAIHGNQRGRGKSNMNPKHRTRTFSIRMNREVLAWLDKTASENGTTRTKVIFNALNIPENELEKIRREFEISDLMVDEFGAPKD